MEASEHGNSRLLSQSHSTRREACSYKKRLGGSRAITADWQLHMAWDVLCEVWDLLMVRWIPTSSMECAITDTLVSAVDVAWYPRNL
jgi:hypothetical protein